jgi:uncharacterized protein (DUF2342 family)
MSDYYGSALAGSFVYIVVVFVAKITTWGSGGPTGVTMFLGYIAPVLGAVAVVGWESRLARTERSRGWIAIIAALAIIVGVLGEQVLKELLVTIELVPSTMEMIQEQIRSMPPERRQRAREAATMINSPTGIAMGALFGAALGAISAYVAGGFFDSTHS